MDTVVIRIETRLREHLLSVSFSFGNELIALLGRDGAGKTEILRAVAGVYTPEHGFIELQGRAVFNAALTINAPPHDRHAGWVPHVNALFPKQNVIDNIAFPLRKSGRLERREAEAPASAAVDAELAGRNREKAAIERIMAGFEDRLGRTVPPSETSYMAVHLCALLDEE